MNLTFKEFKTYLTKFLALKQEQEEWESRLPEDLISLYDNTYVNNMGLQLDLTMELLFGKYWDDVSWFLYECIGSKTIRDMENNISIEDRVYSIKDLDSYLEYAEKEIEFKVDKEA